MKHLGEELEAAWFGKKAGSAGYLQDDRFHYQGLLSGFMAKMQNEVRERTDEWAKWFQAEVEKLGYIYIAGWRGYELPGAKPFSETYPLRTSPMRCSVPIQPVVSFPEGNQSFQGDRLFSSPRWGGEGNRRTGGAFVLWRTCSFVRQRFYLGDFPQEPAISDCQRTGISDGLAIATRNTQTVSNSGTVVKPPYGAVSAEFRVGFGDTDPAAALAALTKLVQGKSRTWKIVVMGKAVQLKFDAPLGLR